MYPSADKYRMVEDGRRGKEEQETDLKMIVKEDKRRGRDRR